MFQYTNRKGTTYYLHGSTDRRGHPRYTMKRSPEGALAEVPAGYEVVENVNGLVSVRRPPPRLISEAEEAMVRSALVGERLSRYQVEVKDRCLTIYEPERDLGDMAAIFEPFGMPIAIGGTFEDLMRKELGDEAIDRYVEQKRQAIREPFSAALTAGHMEPRFRRHLKSDVARLASVGNQ